LPLHNLALLVLNRSSLRQQVLSAISGPLATKFDRNHPIGKLNRGVVSVAAPELPSRPRASAGAVCANSSPAKGRVERAHKTLQDRLVEELRLAWVRILAEGKRPAVGFHRRLQRALCQAAGD
jgi:hypothetical protein